LVCNVSHIRSRLAAFFGYVPDCVRSLADRTAYCADRLGGCSTRANGLLAEFAGFICELTDSTAWLDRSFC
jgi:hypothetical protein